MDQVVAQALTLYARLSGTQRAEAAKVRMARVKPVAAIPAKSGKNGREKSRDWRLGSGD
jgi:hypothetical protein